MHHWRGRAFEVGIPEGWAFEERPESLQIAHEREPGGVITIMAGTGGSGPAPGATEGDRFVFDAAESEDVDDDLLGLRWVAHHEGVAVVAIYLTPADAEHAAELEDVRRIVETVRVLGVPEPSIPEELVERVRVALEKELDTKVERRGESGLAFGSSEVFLDNLYRQCRIEGADEDAAIARFVAALAESKAALEGAFRLDLDAHASLIRPMIKREQDAHDWKWAHRPLVAPLVVVYAIETPLNLVYVSMGAARDAGASVDTLHELALANLASIDFGGYVDGGMGGLQVTDSFNASRLLLPELGVKLAEALDLPSGSDVLVAVPARDMLLYAPVDRYDDFAGAVEIVHREAPHALDPTVLLLSGGRLSRYDPNAGKSFWKRWFG